MPNPDTLLTIVAIRLAGLVAAALVIRALPDLPRQDVACLPGQTVGVHLQKSGAAKPDAEESANAVFRDMRWHD